MSQKDLAAPSGQARAMPKHADCAEVCQQADDYGVWPQYSCSPECVWLKREVGINGLTEAETSATASVFGLLPPPKL